MGKRALRELNKLMCVKPMAKETRYSKQGHCYQEKVCRNNRVLPHRQQDDRLDVEARFKDRASEGLESLWEVLCQQMASMDVFVSSTKEPEHLACG